MFSGACCLPLRLLRRPTVTVLGLLVAALLSMSSLAAVSPADAAVPSAAPGCTISDNLVNSCRPWLGAESGGYGATGFKPSMLEHEARIGRPLDIVHEYLGPGTVLP